VAVERDPKQFLEICKRVVNLGSVLMDKTVHVYNDDKSFPYPTEPMGSKYNFQVEVDGKQCSLRGFPLSAFRRMNGYNMDTLDIVCTDVLDGGPTPSTSSTATVLSSSSSSSSSSTSLVNPIIDTEDFLTYSYVFAEATWETLHGSDITDGFVSRRDTSSDVRSVSSVEDEPMRDGDYEPMDDSEPVRLYLCVCY
jgi:hypothetical protein